MRKPLAVVSGLLALVCICGCGVSTRGAERSAATVPQRTAPAVSSAASLRLAQRPPGMLLVDGSAQGSLTALASHAYTAAGGTATVARGNDGAGVAFTKFCRGQVDIVDSSAPLSSSQLAQCEQAGIRPVQLEVASEAIVLATKSETDVGADCLTVAEVKSIFRAGSPVYNWGQLGFDQIPLSVAGPGPSDSALGFFDRDVLGSTQQSLLDFRVDYQAQPSNQAVRQFVTGSASDADAAAQLTQLNQTANTQSAVFAGAQKTLTGADLTLKDAAFQVTKGVADARPLVTQQQDLTALAAAQAKQKLAQAAVVKQSSALASVKRQILAGRAAQRRLQADLGHLGMFRFSYFAQYEADLRPLEITASASPENCIFPSQQTVTTAAYPLSRQLLITTSVQAAKRLDVRDFLLSYLHNAQRLATQQGLVELPDNVLGREQAFFGASQQQRAGSRSAPSASSTSGAPTSDLPPTVH